MALASIALLAFFGSAPARAQELAPPEPNTPIEHFIFLMQENHSFDNYFGTYPGADGIPSGTCMPLDPRDPNGRCLEPFHMARRPALDLGHSRAAFLGQYREGRMDGFVSHPRREGMPFRNVMGYYDGRDIPYYWNIADEYVLFDRFFSSAGGGSVWNHFFWVTGRPGSATDRLPEDGLETPITIFDRLEEAGVSWKFYVQNYNPRITYRTYQRPVYAKQSAQVVWVPLLSYPRFIDDPALSSKIVDLNEYFRDLQNDTLPSVAFIVPSGSSEHPPSNLRSGERFVRTLIIELMRSPAWYSSAFLWSYDDWGGWYDHVRPPTVDSFGFGFRVPALLVSPYARRGHVESTELDYTSGLKFIEDNWGLEPLGKRDREANSIASAFDFGQDARAPVLLPTTRDGAVSAPAFDVGKPRQAIFATYGASIVGALLLVLIGASVRARRKRTR